MMHELPRLSTTLIENCPQMQVEYMQKQPFFKLQVDSQTAALFAILHADIVIFTSNDRNAG